MKIKINKLELIGFWKGFDYKNNFILNFCKNENHCKIYGSFINKNDYKYINHCKNYLYVTEPIKIFLPIAFNIYNNPKVLKFGSVKNDINNNFCKYPLYLIYFNYKNKDIYYQTNNYVKNINIDNKLFSSLINTHDKWNTRKLIYNKLLKIDKIICPSKLFNNCSNIELNEIGKIEYCKRFIFSLCPENFIFEGYITEKLLHACLSGCIPIYAGSFDDIDGKIFNKNRIIFFNPNDENDINQVYLKILDLINNKDKLLTFYQQDVFLPTAYETCINMEENLIKFLNN